MKMTVVEQVTPVDGKLKTLIRVDSEAALHIIAILSKSILESNCPKDSFELTDYSNSNNKIISIGLASNNYFKEIIDKK